MVFRTSGPALAAALAAVTALAACGPAKMGAAAVVGDERITTARLDSTVAQWHKEFDGNHEAALAQQQAEQQNQRTPFDPDSPHRSALYQLISFRVWEQTAKEQGVTVTQGQIDQLLSQLGGQSRLAPSVLAADVPVRYMSNFARTGLIQQQLLQQYGVMPNAQGQVDPNAQQQAIRRLEAAYTSAAEHLKITTNPRFGRFDPKLVTLNPVLYRLSRTESGTG